MFQDRLDKSEDSSGRTPSSGGSPHRIEHLASELRAITIDFLGGDIPSGACDTVDPEEVIRHLREISGSSCYGLTTPWQAVRQMEAWLALPEKEAAELLTYADAGTTDRTRTLLAGAIRSVRDAYPDEIVDGIFMLMASDLDTLHRFLERVDAGIEPVPSVARAVESERAALATLVEHARLVCEPDGEPGERRTFPASMTHKALASLARLGERVIGALESSGHLPRRQDWPFNDDYRLRGVMVALRDLTAGLCYLRDVVASREPEASILNDRTPPAAGGG